MKATGIVRRVDQLGRIVLPKELKENLEIDKKDPLEIYVDEETVILMKYQPGCTLGGGLEDLVTMNEKNVCGNCIDELDDLYN